jgi:hypothetical protein
MTHKRQTLEISIDGTVFVETESIEVINGQPSSPTVERRSFTPGSDVSDQTDLVKQACQTAWTDSIVSEFNSKLQAANNLSIPVIGVQNA